MKNTKESQESRGILKLWCSVAGPGWSMSEVLLSLITCVLAGLALPFYSDITGYNWTPIQKIAAGWISFDLVGGAIACNSLLFKWRRFGENRILDYILEKFLPYSSCGTLTSLSPGEAWWV